ncbi:RAC family serine/threonine-protein kinase [Grifola frondosa]|uniref:RAC family serine/threonine-protein kinase n=1 Tax=Grifola frondosa TaxID=5627 RepID=A0A1C7MEM5_GRIFR|nr:RAC family serine/threonine-protein kinase [Grifola frondosa]
MAYLMELGLRAKNSQTSVAHRVAYIWFVFNHPHIPSTSPYLPKLRNILNVVFMSANAPRGAMAIADANVHQSVDAQSRATRSGSRFHYHCSFVTLFQRIATFSLDNWFSLLARVFPFGTLRSTFSDPTETPKCLPPSADTHSIPPISPRIERHTPAPSLSTDSTPSGHPKSASSSTESSCGTEPRTPSDTLSQDGSHECWEVKLLDSCGLSRRGLYTSALSESTNRPTQAPAVQFQLSSRQVTHQVPVAPLLRCQPTADVLVRDSTVRSRSSLQLDIFGRAESLLQSTPSPPIAFVSDVTTFGPLRLSTVESAQTNKGTFPLCIGSDSATNQASRSQQSLLLPATELTALIPSPSTAQLTQPPWFYSPFDISLPYWEPSAPWCFNPFDEDKWSPTETLVSPDDEVITGPRIVTCGAIGVGANYVEYHSGQITLHNGSRSYRVLDLIAEGGFGRVMSAEDRHGALVAVKIIEKKSTLYSGENGRELVLCEKNFMEKAARDSAGFLMRLESSWEDASNIYFVMRYYYDDLRSRIGSGEMRREDVRLCCAELIMALEELKNLAIVHCDLKPENIMVDVHGHLRIADFGLARCPPPNKTCDFNEFRFYNLIGTPSYMAPEVVSSTMKLVGFTHAADSYSLGLILLELMLGTGSYWSAITVEEQRQQMRDKPLDIGSLPLDDVEKDLLEKILAINPEERWHPINCYCTHISPASIWTRLGAGEWIRVHNLKSGDGESVIVPADGVSDLIYPFDGLFDFYRPLDAVENERQGRELVQALIEELSD